MGSHREVLLLYFSVVLLGSGHCQFTDEEMEQLLDGHNNIRATVQPVAANMERMEWDDELAGIAQDHLGREGCNFRSNTQRTNRQNRFDLVGELLNVENQSPPPDWSTAIQNIFATLDYDFTANQCNGGACDNYKQVVWSATRYVGCGVIACPRILNVNNIVDVFYYICHYGPSFDLSPRPYTEGVPCSDCPDDLNQCVDNLCSPPLPTSAPLTTQPATTPFVTTQPETTQPATTQPETTQPATTPPATTQPETTPPATSQPATTQPATTQPATTQPATTQPETTPPATSQPATTQPATTQPATTQPATTPPETTQPETTQPETTQPETSEPITTPPETTPPLTTQAETSPSPTTTTTTSRPTRPACAGQRGFRRIICLRRRICARVRGFRPRGTNCLIRPICAGMTGRQRITCILLHTSSRSRLFGRRSRLFGR